MKRLKYAVKGMSCSACVAHVERAAGKICGEQFVSVSLLTNSLSVTVPDDTNEKELFSTLKRALKKGGYSLLADTAERDAITESQQKRGLVRLIASCVLSVLLMYVAMGGMLSLPLPVALTDPLVSAIVQLFLTLPVVILNFRFFKSGFSSLIRLAPSMDSLIAIGSGASLVYGAVMLVLIGVSCKNGDAQSAHKYAHGLYFESAAMILTLVSLGKMLEGRARASTGRAIGRLASMLPDTATVIRTGEELEIPLADIQVGDIVVIRAGETIPVDGTIVEGKGAVDESALTGESIPAERAVNDKVSAVCTLTAGYIKIEATRVGEDTTLSRIIGLLEQAAASKAPIVRMADRVSRIFVPTVMAISTVTLVVWLIVTGDIGRALDCAVSVLVISCPCALGLATPTAVMVGTGRAAEYGILIKSAEALEKLCSVEYLLTDKTGTLTEGKPRLTDMIAVRGTSEQMLLLAYSVEAMSAHPLALAVCDKAEALGLERLSVEAFEDMPGMGISAKISGGVCLVGAPELLVKNKIDISALNETLSMLELQGKTVACVAHEGVALGVLGIADKARPDSKKAVGELTDMGIHSVMLTGDNQRTAQAIADECGITEVCSRLLPTDKQRIVSELSDKGVTVMVGDGINDAPALARADVGIAIGAGTDVAIDCADVVLSKNSLLDAVTAIRLSRATIRTIKENLFWALVYNSVCIPIAAGVIYPIAGVTLSPMIASAAMSFSSIFVVLNSLRLKYKRL